MTLIILFGKAEAKTFFRVERAGATTGSDAFLFQIHICSLARCEVYGLDFACAK